MPYELRSKFLYYKFLRFVKKHSLFVIVLFLLFVSIKENIKQTKTYNDYKTSNEYLKNYKVWSGMFKTTIYTLHPSECSKKKQHQHYGITFTGVRAVSGRTVAVDPDFVNLGSVIIDPETDKHWIAEDTGNGVNGYHLDFFVGEGTNGNRKIANDYGLKRKFFIVIEQPRKYNMIEWVMWQIRRKT